MGGSIATSPAATLRSLARQIRELTTEAADHRQATLVLVQASEDARCGPCLPRVPVPDLD
jgi:hypothetical protein